MAAIPLLRRQMDPGWIDCSVIDDILQKPIKILCCIDGSEASAAGFDYVVKGLMQRERASTGLFLHVYDDSKTYLPPAWRKEQLKMLTEATCIGNLSSGRYKISFLPRIRNTKVGVTIVNKLEEAEADFVCMGFWGRKGRSRRHGAVLASNVMEVLQRGTASAIVMQQEDAKDLPIGRSATFVVSVSLNQAATKAFIDALHLSKPGDEIHVVYIKSYMERTDSDYTNCLRQKYQGLFEGLQGEQDQEVLAKFADRLTKFHLVPKQLRETTSQAVNRMADELNADFIVVGTNRLRVERGKPFLGSVSFQIILDTDKNFVVSNWSPSGNDQREGAYLKD